MPSHHLIRRDSWPPTILRLGHEQPLDIADTDANPFSYFLEPVIPADIADSSDDDDTFLDLSAGIESADSKTQQVREVSPSSLQRLPILSDEELEAEQAERDLHDWLSVPARRKTQPVTGALSMKGRATGAARGRGLMRSVPRQGPVTRSHSAGVRGRAWREPSPEIGVIAEEAEDVEMVDSPSPSESGAKLEGAQRKLRKRVHWATPVEKTV